MFVSVGNIDLLYLGCRRCCVVYDFVCYRWFTLICFWGYVVLCLRVGLTIWVLLNCWCSLILLLIMFMVVYLVVWITWRVFDCGYLLSFDC